MNDIYLPPTARRNLRRWLSGRERITGIDRLRYVQFQSEESDTISPQELTVLIDCTGYGLLDALK